MKNNTKVRLHLSKKLFESLTREIIKEAKANDGYTVAVKQPKQPKQVKEVNAVEDTDKMKKMEEKMSSKEKMAKGLYNEVDAEMDTDKMKKIKEMEMNVAEEGQMNEIADISWEAVAAGMAAMGLAPLAIDKMHQWWKKKYPCRNALVCGSVFTRSRKMNTSSSWPNGWMSWLSTQRGAATGAKRP